MTHLCDHKVMRSGDTPKLIRRGRSDRDNVGIPSIFAVHKSAERISVPPTSIHHGRYPRHVLGQMGIGDLPLTSMAADVVSVRPFTREPRDLACRAPVDGEEISWNPTIKKREWQRHPMSACIHLPR